MRGSVETNGPLIRQLREHRCWTKADLAQKAGVSEKTIENAENSKRLDRASLTRISKAFSVPVNKIKRESEQDAFMEGLAERPQSIDVEIRVSLPLELLSGDAQVKQLIDALLNAAALSSHINVMSARRGSTVIRIEMSIDDAARFFEALCEARLDPSAVEALTYFPSPGSGKPFYDTLVAIKSAHDANNEIDIVHFDERTPNDDVTDAEFQHRIALISQWSSTYPERCNELMQALTRQRLLLMKDGRPEAIKCINRRMVQRQEPAFDDVQLLDLLFD